MPGVGGATGHDGRGDPGGPGRGGGPSWRATASDWGEQRPGVAGRGGGGVGGEGVRSWLESTGSGALYVAPASPWQNGYAESFHSKLRDEFLDLEDFESEAQARALGALWKEEYNTERPHSSLGYRTPAEFAATCARYVPIEEHPTEPSITVQPHP